MSPADHNKYLDHDEYSSSDESEECDLHELILTATIVEFKDAVMKDRPRNIALKDKVSTCVQSN